MPEARADSFPRSWITAAALGAFVFTFVLMLGRPVVRSDEAWLLWVAHRIAHGNTLYRDVNSVTTPLPIWIAAGAIRVFGTHLIVVRALTTACFVATLLVSDACMFRSGLNRLGRSLVLLLLFVYASPIAHFASLYSQLAILFSLATLWSILRWLDTVDAQSGRSPSELLFGVGLLCAGAFDSKPNIGLLAFAAALTVIVVHGRARGRKSLADCRRAATGFAGGIAVILVPILISGGFANFLGDVFGEKPEYLRVMRDEFPPGLAQLAHGLSSAPSTIGERFVDTLPLLVGLAIALLVWAAVKTPRAEVARMVAFASFGLAAAMSAFPQPGPQHLTEVAPLLLTTAASAFAVARAGTAGLRFARAGVLILASWLVVGGIAVVARAVSPPDGLGFATSAVPHFEGTPGAPSDAQLKVNLARLHTLTRGEVFIVRSDASFLYLAGGLRNPTRFDFPVRSDLGASGEAGVVRAIARGSLRWVCLGHHVRHNYDSLRPREIERAVQSRLHLAARLHVCDLYGQPVDASGTSPRNGERR